MVKIPGIEKLAQGKKIANKPMAPDAKPVKSVKSSASTPFEKPAGKKTKSEVFTAAKIPKALEKPKINGKPAGGKVSTKKEPMIASKDNRSGRLKEIQTDRGIFRDKSNRKGD